MEKNVKRLHLTNCNLLRFQYKFNANFFVKGQEKLPNVHASNVQTNNTVDDENLT